MPASNIAIIGAGVSGLTCAVALAETGQCVTVLAEQVAQATTSGAAAAIWFPYDAEPADKVIAWALTTYNSLRQLARDPVTGVSMIELRCFARAGEISIPDWARDLGATGLRKTHESRAGEFPSAFQSGFSMSVPLTDTTRYLDYLRKRFVQANGTIDQGVRLHKLEDISGLFRVMVNCSGIGARELTHDSELEPHRGQVEIVPKFDLPYAIVSDDPPLMYAIPRRDDCVLGGSNSINANCEPDLEERRAILRECSRVLSISEPAVIATRVGLRPYRKSGVRLEAQRLSDGRSVIHNYGHGGSGFTLSWGCAEEVVRLVGS